MITSHEKEEEDILKVTMKEGTRRNKLGLNLVEVEKTVRHSGDNYLIETWLNLCGAQWGSFGKEF